MRNGKANGRGKQTMKSPMSARLHPGLTGRLQDVVAASRRTQTSVLEESLEVQLPVLEKRYEPELRKLRRQRRKAVAA